MKKKIFEKCIIYLFVITSLISASGYAFGEECRVFSSVCCESASSVSAPVISTNEGLHTFHVRKCNTIMLRFRALNDTCSEVALRSGFLFLSVLAILSVLFRFIQMIIEYYQCLYVPERFVVVRFIHNKDGRKRSA